MKEHYYYYYAEINDEMMQESLALYEKTPAFCLGTPVQYAMFDRGDARKVERRVLAPNRPHRAPAAGTLRRAVLQAPGMRQYQHPPVR